MTDITVLRQEAAAARAAAAGGKAQAVGVPGGDAHRDHIKFGSEIRAKKVQKDGQDFYQVEGYASVFERGYDMWDEYGPYTEVVSKGAADKTLQANPFVIFRFNHGNTPMASTGNGRLELSADDIGLHMRAWLNPSRDDVRLLMQAIEDQDVTEQSFMFMIVRGIWSPDYTEYRIEQFDLDRGDVGPVTYGANPHTSIAARSAEILAAIPGLPRLAAREALQMLSGRTDLAAEPAKKSVEEPQPGRRRGLTLEEAARWAREADAEEAAKPKARDYSSLQLWRAKLLATEAEIEADDL
jgi:HK97 family phage prohead protease